MTAATSRCSGIEFARSRGRPNPKPEVGTNKQETGKMRGLSRFDQTATSCLHVYIVKVSTRWDDMIRWKSLKRAF